MRTASELRAEVGAEYERAGLYERLVGEKAMLQQTIAKPRSVAAQDADVLRRLYEETSKLSPDALTGSMHRGVGNRATHFAPFSVQPLLNLRDVLRPIIAAALERAHQIAEKENEVRANAIARLAVIDRELEEFKNE